MASIKSPYYRTQLETDVIVFPNQINKNIDENLMINLRNLVENKCVKNGYVMKIYDIVEKGDGKIDDDNLSGYITYHVKYTCYLCSPVVNLEMVCEVMTMSNGFLVGKNGPMTVILSHRDINLQVFNIEHNNQDIKYLPNGSKLRIGDYIKVVVSGRTMVTGENRIGVFASLNEMASKKEIETYHNDLQIDEQMSRKKTKEFI